MFTIILALFASGLGVRYVCVCVRVCVLRYNVTLNATKKLLGGDALALAAAAAAAGGADERRRAGGAGLKRSGDPPWLPVSGPWLL